MNDNNDLLAIRDILERGTLDHGISDEELHALVDMALHRISAASHPGNNDLSTRTLRMTVNALTDVLTSDDPKQELSPDIGVLCPEAAELARTLAELREFALALANGDLDHRLQMRGSLAGALKTLQANLRHLAWQAQQVANEDFSQRVMFMGSFSDAFNTMVARLDDNRIRLGAQDDELRGRYSKLQAEMDDRERVETALHVSETRFALLLDNAPFPVVIVRMNDLSTVYANEKALDLFQMDHETVIEYTLAHQCVSRTMYKQLIDKLNEHGSVQDYEIELRRRGKKNTFWAHISATLVTQNDEVTAILAYNDITEPKRINDALQALATRDTLTGLKNRRAIWEYAENEILRADRDGTPLMVAMVDIDHFKDVNDTYGHQVGDEALTHVANEICTSLRSYDGVGRYGGEEFLLIIPNTGRETSYAIAERLREYIADRHIEAGAVTLTLTVSVGIAIRQVGEALDLSDLLSEADRVSAAVIK